MTKLVLIGKRLVASMVLMDLECKSPFSFSSSGIEALILTWYSRYNGTSDLQLERMSVYFNEVNKICPPFLVLDLAHRG